MKNSTVQKRCEVRCKMEEKGKQEIRVQMGSEQKGHGILGGGTWGGGVSCLHNGNQWPNLPHPPPSQTRSTHTHTHTPLGEPLLSRASLGQSIAAHSAWGMELHLIQLQCHSLFNLHTQMHTQHTSTRIQQIREREGSWGVDSKLLSNRPFIQPSHLHHHKKYK